LFYPSVSHLKSFDSVPVVKKLSTI
jgi:hypothetical protein